MGTRNPSTNRARAASARPKRCPVVKSRFQRNARMPKNVIAAAPSIEPPAATSTVIPPKIARTTRSRRRASNATSRASPHHVASPATAESKTSGPTAIFAAIANHAAHWTTSPAVTNASARSTPRRSESARRCARIAIATATTAKRTPTRSGLSARGARARRSRCRRPRGRRASAPRAWTRRDAASRSRSEARGAGGRPPARPRTRRAARRGGARS